MTPFAKAVIMPDGTAHIVIGEYASDYYRQGMEHEARSDAAKINVAISTHDKDIRAKAFEEAARIADEISYVTDRGGDFERGEQTAACEISFAIRKAKEGAQ